MRTEKEMLAMLKAAVYEDERIRAAYLEGSRANPKVPRDLFQDYDVEFIVTDTAPFREEKAGSTVSVSGCICSTRRKVLLASRM